MQLAGDVVGSDALARAEGLTDGDVLLLENIRFDPRETSKDEAERESLAKALRSWSATTAPSSPTVSVSCTASRPRLTTSPVAAALRGQSGGRRGRRAGKLTHEVERPYAVVLGGSKVSDKLGVIESLAPRSTPVIGGGMAFTFLAAQVIRWAPHRCRQRSDRRLQRPAGTIRRRDRWYCRSMWWWPTSSPPMPTRRPLPPTDPGRLDGPGHRTRIRQTVYRSALGAKTIFWNGPSGVFEFEKFADGTRGVAEAIAETTAGGAFTVVGGGDSAAAVRTLGLPDSVSPHLHRRRCFAGIFGGGANCRGPKVGS